MIRIRNETLTCSYCGHYQPITTEHKFCPDCLGSEYLKESDLKLTRLVPVSQKWTRKTEELTSDELAERLPAYKHAQLHGHTERDKAHIAAQRLDIENEYKKIIHHAKIEHDGLLWLLDHGIKTNNVIYYDHKRIFSFGWRNPLSDDMRNAVLEVISEFPFPYELVCANGNTLEGY